MNLILVTVDCLRADHIGVLGYDRPTTPFLDQLSEESLLFERAVVAGLPTFYSFPAIMASRYPLSLGRDLVGLAPGEATLSNVLKESGYTTAAFLAGNPYLSRRFHYDQGFDLVKDFLLSTGHNSEEKQKDWQKFDRSTPSRLRRINLALQKVTNLWSPLQNFYNDLYSYYTFCVERLMSGGELSVLRPYASADVVIQSALQWLDEQPAERPFFLWLHLMDPHNPYYPPPEAFTLMGQRAISVSKAHYLNVRWNWGNLEQLKGYRDEVMGLYDASIRWVDEQIKRLVEGLEERNLWNKSLFVLTSDHGEEFLEHGGRYHYPTKLPQELVHVPLLIHHPAGLVGGRSTTPFSLIDLSPTLLNMLDLVAPASFAGQSRWQDDALKDNMPLTITECVYDCANPWLVENRLGARLLAVQTERYKLLLNFATNEEQLFDLQDDAKEMKPIPANVPHPVRQQLLTAALNHIRDSQPKAGNRTRLAAQLAELKYSLRATDEKD